MDIANPHGLVAILVAPFVGSFIGLVATRHGTGRGVVSGRSQCDACGRTPSVRDLVPIASWIWLRGRCRTCGARIVALQFWVEMGSLALAVVAAVVLPGVLVWAGCALAWLLIAIAAIDARHGQIPDALSLPLLAIGLGIDGLGGRLAFVDGAIGAAAGFAVFFAIAWTYRRLRGRDGLGDGDFRLAAAAGAWVGWQGLPAVVLYGAASGLAGALVMTGGLRGLDGARPIPFGPFLGLGTWIVWMWGAPFAPPPWLAL